MSLTLADRARQGKLAETFASTNPKVRKSETVADRELTHGITHSIIKAENALYKEQYQEASKFYKYALRLSEMQFGEDDLVVKNLRLLLRGIDEFLNQGQKKPQMIVKSDWRDVSD